MITNSQLLTTEPKNKNKNKNKNKLSKQLEQEQNHRNGDHNGGLSTGEWERERGGKGTENKQHKWQVENREGKGKNSIGNGEAKELICMTHGNELRWGNAGGRWGTGQRGIQRRKNGTIVIV